MKKPEIWSPAPHEWGVAVHVFDPRTQKVVEGGSEEVQGQFGIDKTLSKQRGKKKSGV